MITFYKEEVGIHLLMKEKTISTQLWGYFWTPFPWIFSFHWCYSQYCPASPLNKPVFPTWVLLLNLILAFFLNVFLKCHKYVILLKVALRTQMCHRTEELTDSCTESINMKVDGIFSCLCEKRWNNEFSSQTRRTQHHTGRKDRCKNKKSCNI